MNEWSHLPNAAHIDAAIASVAAHPNQWHAVAITVEESQWITAWDAARVAVLSKARDAAWVPARAAAYRNVWGAPRCAVLATGAILALIAYDECAYMLTMPLDQVRVLAALELSAAVLLLPAMVAVEAIDNLAVI